MLGTRLSSPRRSTIPLRRSVSRTVLFARATISRMPQRLEGVVDGPERLRAGHVDLADRLEVEDDRVGRRLAGANPREQVVLEDVGVGEDQLRLEAMDHARRGSASPPVSSSRSLKREPSRLRPSEAMCGWSIVWISRMKLRATPIATPGRMLMSEHPEQGAERGPELE